MWLRRGEVIAGLGITAEVFDKLVRSRVVVAKYFPGQTRAFFEREAVAKVAPQERKETTDSTDGRGNGADGKGKMNGRK